MFIYTHFYKAEALTVLSEVVLKTKGHLVSRGKKLRLSQKLAKK